jgi:hypothetical protein
MIVAAMTRRFDGSGGARIGPAGLTRLLLVAISLVAAALAARVSFGLDGWFWNLDVPKIDYPLASFFHEALARGELPLWNDRLGLGFPLYAEGQIGAFYPPNWLIFQFDPLAAMDLTRLLHLTLAGVGAGLLALRVSGSRQGALLAAVIAVLGGAVVSKVEWWNLVAAYAWLPWVLLPLAVALLGYALLVRKNAVVAILPMLYLLYRSWFPPRRPIALAVLVGSLLVVTGFTQVLINATAHPLKTDQLSAIAIDDVIHVVPRGALQKADLPIPLRDKLLAAQQVCDAKKSLMNNYWTCYGRGAAGPFTPIADHAALTKAWPGLMLQRPAGYLQYRSEVYGEFLFHNRDYWQDGVLANSMGIDVARPRMVATLRSYVVDGALRNFPWLFGAWFWLVVSVVQTLRLRSRSGFGVLVPCLGASSLLYILGYFPTAPATDYRYVYWPAVAGTLGLLVMALDRFGPRAPTAAEGDHDGEGDGERKQRDGTTAEAGVSGATA